MISQPNCRTKTRIWVSWLLIIQIPATSRNHLDGLCFSLGVSVCFLENTEILELAQGTPSHLPFLLWQNPGLDTVQILSQALKSTVECRG